MMSRAFTAAINELMKTKSLTYEEAVQSLAQSLSDEGLKNSSEALLKQAKLPALASTLASEPKG